MERNFYDTDFEDLLKEKADQYKMYPSDKVWKGIDRSLRSRRKWYWTGFVVLLSGISYLAVNELIKPSTPVRIQKAVVRPVAPDFNTPQITPFSADPIASIQDPQIDRLIPNGFIIQNSDQLTTTLEIPLITTASNDLSEVQAPSQSLIIAGIDPNTANAFNLRFMLPELNPVSNHEEVTASETGSENDILNPGLLTSPADNNHFNWLQDQAVPKLKATPSRHIRWQLAFSPTVNYRKMTGAKNARLSSSSGNIPLALNIPGDINSLLDHKPALGFELGTHGLLSLTRSLTLKGGIQFNYSKYDIHAYKSGVELATISLNATAFQSPGTLTSYTDIRNFSGSSSEELKNQYFQLSLPVGLELRLLGNDRIQLNIAGTIQPTYLLNGNTYLITNDYKNYTKAPSLVRKWNMNTGFEAFLSYDRGGIKWQVGPQFRYQLLSSYKNAYPIKEYLMEYGIKIGVTKTIR